MRRFGEWVNRRAVRLLVLLVLGSVAVTAVSYTVQSERRDQDRAEAAKGYVLVLRSACEDRNVRDAKILSGVRDAAIRLGGGPEDVPELAEALAPRDCVEIYPLPKKGQTGPLRESEPSSTAPRQPFSSCEAAALGGMTPLYEGDAGFNPDLDADGDGIACE